MSMNEIYNSIHEQSMRFKMLNIKPDVVIIHYVTARELEQNIGARISSDSVNKIFGLRIFRSEDIPIDEVLVTVSKI